MEAQVGLCIVAYILVGTIVLIAVPVIIQIWIDAIEKIRDIISELMS